MFAWNLILALTWMILIGEFKIQSVVSGFIVSYCLLALLTSRGVIDSSSYVYKVRQVLAFGVFFLYELILANFKMAGDALRPGCSYRPGILALPLDVKTDAEITLLAHLMTLTPGSLSLDVSTDKKILYIHVMHIDQGDNEKVKESIQQGFEKKVKQLLS